MDISPRTRVLKNMTSECLRLIRTTYKLSADEADRCLLDLPSKMQGWMQSLEDPPMETFIPEVQGYQGYSLWADTYDDDPNNRVILAEEEHIWNIIGPVAGKRILDVGCGTGRHSLRLAELGAAVVSSEPNETVLGIARRKAESKRNSIQWLNHTIETLPSILGKFDTVLCCLVLSHVADLQTAVSKLSTFVTDGGSIVISDFHPFNLMIGWRTSFHYEGRKYVVPNYLHLPSSYFDALKAAGLTVEDFIEVGEFPQLPDQPATIILKGRRKT